VTALIRVAPNLRAVFAAHVVFEFMSWGHLRSANDIQGDCLMRVTAETPDLKVQISCVERVSQRRRRLGRPFIPKHALIPRLAS
jgi:hypothetical protein